MIIFWAFAAFDRTIFHDVQNVSSAIFSNWFFREILFIHFRFRRSFFDINDQISTHLLWRFFGKRNFPDICVQCEFMNPQSSFKWTPRVFMSNFHLIAFRTKTCHKNHETWRIAPFVFMETFAVEISMFAHHGDEFSGKRVFGKQCVWMNPKNDWQLNLY